MTWQDISTAPRDGRVVSRKRLIAVDFACNDPDNGNFAGRVGAASVHDCDLELDPLGGVKFSVDVKLGTLRLHRRTFRFRQWGQWVGNWCWNRYCFTPTEYRRLIRTLAWNGWSCTGGLSRWSDAFDALPRKPLPSPPEGTIYECDP
jgi:hypothetical protein